MTYQRTPYEPGASIHVARSSFPGPMKCGCCGYLISSSDAYCWMHETTESVVHRRRWRWFGLVRDYSPVRLEQVWRCGECDREAADNLRYGWHRDECRKRTMEQRDVVLADSYRAANWRNTTPVDQSAKAIGVGFDLADGGKPIRLRLSLEHARHLHETLTEWLSEYVAREYHRWPPLRMPSIDWGKVLPKSTPDAVMNQDGTVVEVSREEFGELTGRDPKPGSTK